jgi:hypothetical protein
VVAGRVTLTLAGAFLALSCSSPPFEQVSDSRTGAYEPSLAVFHDGFTVVWYDTRTGHGEIYARSLDADGRPSGPELALTNGPNDAYEADVQPVEGLAGGEALIVAWYEKTREGRAQPRLGLWSRNGAARWIRTLAPDGRNTVVRVHGDAVFAAWVQDETPPNAGLWAGWWSITGDPIVAPRRIADASKTTYNLNAALGAMRENGMPDAVVAFDATVGTRADELFLAEDTVTATRVTRLTPDDGRPSKYPDLVIAGAKAALTWYDTRDGNEEVYVSVGGLAELFRPDALEGRRVTRTPGHSIGAYAAWNGNRVGVAWCDDSAGQHEIYFEDFDAAGMPLHAARRLTETHAASLIPAIRPWRSGFALTWNEYEGGGHAQGGHSTVVFKLLTAD